MVSQPTKRLSHERFEQGARELYQPHQKRIESDYLESLEAS
nr:MAG TPA: hypothetical protein [Caudoviricetes sp.]